jgi:hypothetical protein
MLRVKDLNIAKRERLAGLDQQFALRVLAFRLILVRDAKGCPSDDVSLGHVAAAERKGRFPRPADPPNCNCCNQADPHPDQDIALPQTLKSP